MDNSLAETLSLTEELQEDERLDYRLKEWEVFKEKKFLEEFKEKGEKEYGQ